MKRYILLIPAVIIMAACSKKNNPAPLSPATAKATDLVGKWTITADTLFLNGSNQFSVNPVNGGPYFQFNDDGTATSGTAGGGVQGVYNYTVNNGTLVLTIPNSSGSVAGSEETLSIYNITKSSLGLRSNNNNNTYEDAWLTK